MPGGRRWGAGWRGSKFPFRESRGFHRTCNRCVHPSSAHAPSPAACIRNGCPDRNEHTACRSAVRSRTWDRGPRAGLLAARCRIVRSVRRRVCRACSPALAPCCSLVWQAVKPAFEWARRAAFARGRDPDIRADGISLPQNLPQAAYCLAGWRVSASALTTKGTKVHQVKSMVATAGCDFVVDIVLLGTRAFLLYNKTMIHEIFPVGPLQCNCSIIGDESTREAMVIDPGDDIDGVIALLHKHNLKVKQIVITHAHIDHVGGAMKLRAATGAPILLNQNDYELLKMLDVQASWIGVAPPGAVEIDQSVNNGDTIKAGSHKASVLHTPGHTEGSICLYFPAEKMLIAGEPLFARSIR